MASAPHDEIQWFQNEIAVCEEAIQEIESDSFYGSSKREILAQMRNTLASHREVLAKLTDQRAQGED